MRVSLLALALVAALAAPALAADLPTHKAPAPPPVAADPAFAWGGVYVGGFAGGNWAHVTPHDITHPGFIGDRVLNSNGLTAGGLVGYNYAFNGFVLGGEAEAGYDRRGTNANYLGGNPLGNRNVADSGASEGRLRGRIGYGWGNFLLFAAAGGTLSDLKLTYTNLQNAFSQEIDKRRVGFNIGGGLEWAFANHWILRGEYIFDDYQAPRYAFHEQNPAGFDSASGKYSESTARAALIYKF